ncbi:MAG TPA: sigma factor-like helix-turn-helix DNA-binding protein [Steroidobacteraceae bacterium]|jgi:Sigma-70, region 4.|nr:sigma factor-like helix-turn-helix DNA-binding protein [Steroidobacteraceae bacterium]
MAAVLRFSKVDVLAREVSRRLCAQNDASLLNDPHSHVLRIATEVEAEWEGRARRSRVGGSGDAIPAPSASSFDAIRAAVLALRLHQRQLLLLHVDGLSYRQIAARHSLPPQAVLRELARAYCQLRWTLPDTR